MAPDGRRRDTLAFKEKLNQVLGTNATHYWSALKEFLTGRLNRDEFDHWATLYLPADQIYLHNEFLLATLFNALVETPPNDNKGQKRKFGETETEAEKAAAAAGENGANAVAVDAKDERPKKKKETAAEAKHRELKQAVRALTKAERDHLRHLLKKKSNLTSEHTTVSAAASRISYPPPLVKLARDAETLPGFAAEYMRTLQAPFSSDAKGIPSGDALLDRMYAVAMEQGIHGIQQDAVRLMFSALEMHMKTIIEQCIIKLRANRLFGIRTRNATHAIVEGRSQDGVATTATTTTTATSAVIAPSTTADHVVAMEEDNNDEHNAATTTEAVAGAGATATTDKPTTTTDKKEQGRRRRLNDSTTIRPRDLLFVAQVSPYILVESPLNIERLNSVVLSNTRLEHDLSQQRAKQLMTTNGSNLAEKEETVEQAALDEFLDSVLGIQYA